MKFDMGQAWSRAMELMRDNFQLLAVIAGVFLLVPTLAAYLLLPDFQTLMDPTADPDQMAEMIQANIGPFIGIGMAAMVLQFAGYGAMVALIGDSRPTVGEALKRGLTIVPSTFGVFLLFVIGYFVIALAIAVPVGILASLASAPGLSIIAVIVVLAAIVWLMARMCMSMPVLVFEDTLNPITASLRSFKLTKSSQWRIIVFWGVLFVAYMVVALLATSVFGLIAALAANSTVGVVIIGLANGIMGMIVGMVICALAVAMYGQLAGPSETAISETFE